LPAVIGVRGARHDNLRDVDVGVPPWRTVAVAGVSGSGKTSLAMGTLYAEGPHRFLESPRCSAATAPIMTGWP
jgi:excinuclease ABC subunit A